MGINKGVNQSISENEFFSSRNLCVSSTWIYWGKEDPSLSCGLLAARLYEFTLLIKFSVFIAISVELCWLYSPRLSIPPRFILQKHTAGLLLFHCCSFLKNTAALPSLDSKLIIGLWCKVWWICGFVLLLFPLIFSIFSPSLSLCQSDSNHLRDLAQKAGAAWCGWYRQEARTFCVG